MKFHIMKSSSVSRYFYLFGPNILLSNVKYFQNIGYSSCPIITH